MKRLKREDCETWKRIKVLQRRGENRVQDHLGLKRMAAANTSEKETTVAETVSSKGASGLWCYGKVMSAACVGAQYSFFTA